jgi:hypothetical protein
VATRFRTREFQLTPCTRKRFRLATDNAGTFAALAHPRGRLYQGWVMPQATAKAAPLTAATTDGELLERARLRDEQAFRLIMQRNNRRLYRIARGILRNDSEAEDVVQ